MKKIVIDARIISLSTGRYVAKLLENLQCVDKENQYIVLFLKKDFDSWQPTSPNFRKVVADYPIYSLSEQLQFCLQLYRLRADLVHFTMPQHPILYLKRHIVTIHDITLVHYVNKRRGGLVKDVYKHHIKPFVFKQVIRLSITTASHIITPTDYVKTDLVKTFGANPRKLTRTYEAADKMVNKRSKTKGQKRKVKRDYILYVGNFFPYKNIRRLIDAVHQIHQTKPGLELVLVGKKDFFVQELEAYIKQKGITGVTFAGFVSDEELAAYYAEAKLYAFASLSEGFGLPVLEAMQYGLPVVSSNASCSPEVYGGAVAYFDPRNTEDMVRVIEEIISDPKQQKALIARGYKQLGKYSWATMAQETLAVYRQSIADRE